MRREASETTLIVFWELLLGALSMLGLLPVERPENKLPE